MNFDRCSKIQKHDRYLQRLKDELRDKYDFLYTNIKLTTKKRTKSEIDLMGIRGSHVDIYEVKCSFRITKARHQLKKIRRMLNLADMSTYFYCGSTRQIQLVL